MEGQNQIPKEKRKTFRHLFTKNVYVKFPDNTEFTMAKLRDISVSGLSCFSAKDIKRGTVLTVEIDIQAISDGKIEERSPHIVKVVSLGAFGSDEKGKSIIHFKFIKPPETCLQNIKKAIFILEQKKNALKEPPPSSSSAPVKKMKNKEQIVDDIRKISEAIKNGKITPPVLPKVVEEVQKIAGHPEKDIESLSNVIKNDAMISARLLSIANSPFFKGMEKCRTVKAAITRIGIEQTYNAVLAIANKSLYQTKNQQIKTLLENLWKHSLACAYAAQKLAEKVPHANPDHMFTIGIVHDIGKSVLLKIFGESVSKSDKVDIEDILPGIQEFHSGISGVILRHWKMSREFVKAATMHEGQKFSKGTDRAVLIISIANQLAQQTGFGITGETFTISELESVQLLHLDMDSIMSVGEKVKELMDKSALIDA